MPFSVLGSLVDLAYNEVNYHRSLENQQRLFAREDNAVQRRMEDLKKAGLNPLLAVGSPASSGMSSVHAGSSSFGSNIGELSDYLKNNYSAIKEQQEIAVQNSRADLANKEATKELLNAQKLEAETRTLKAIADTENVNVKTRESAYNLGLYESLNVPTNSSGLIKDLTSGYGFFDEFIRPLFNKDKSEINKPKEKKLFEKLPKNSYNKDEVLKSFDKAKEKNKRFAH